jgi:hypothetical protein
MYQYILVHTAMYVIFLILDRYRPEWELFRHGTYQYILVHTAMYVILLVFGFCCTLLGRLKAAHLLLPTHTRFQAQPSLLLSRFRLASPRCTPRLPRRR